MTDDDKDTMSEAITAVTAIYSTKETIRTIRAALSEQMPEVMEELAEAERALPGLQEAAKPVLRQLGQGSHLVAGHFVVVKAAASKTKVDTEGLVERARDRDDVRELLDAGVLVYTVAPQQIARLPAKLRAIYESYVTFETGTASVVLPESLK